MAPRSRVPAELAEHTAPHGDVTQPPTPALPCFTHPPLPPPLQVNYVCKAANLYEDAGYQLSGASYVINKSLGTSWLWARCVAGLLRWELCQYTRAEWHSAGSMPRRLLHMHASQLRHPTFN